MCIVLSCEIVGVFLYTATNSTLSKEPILPLSPPFFPFAHLSSQMLIKHLLCARHCGWHYECSIGHDRRAGCIHHAGMGDKH